MILAAVGLQREARIVGGPQVTAICGGGRSAALEAALADAAPGAEGLISIGVCGALAPGLKPGDAVIAGSVAWSGGEAAADARWIESLTRRLPDAKAGGVFGSDAMLTQARDKRAAHARTGALAVDMESHVAARAAAAAGVRFAALRVVTDAADCDLPPAVLVGMDADGRMALLPVLKSLAARPGQLPALIRAGRDAGRAFRGLADAHRLLGPRLGLPDLGELALDVG